MKTPDRIIGIFGLGSAIFFVTSLLLLNVARALPPRQHLAQGTVAAIDRGEIVLAATPAGKDTPTVFAIKENRTRWRENGKKAPLDHLKVGQLVRVYYRKEMGTWVATEVSWTLPASPPPTSVSRPR